MWKQDKSYEGVVFWKDGWNEVWLENGLYNLYSYKPSRGKKLDFIQSFFTLEGAQAYGDLMGDLLKENNEGTVSSD